MKLERPLQVFGAAFSVEVSSALSLNPDTVLRAALGKSFQTILRDADHLQPLKQVHDALRGSRTMSSTTRATLLRRAGPTAPLLAAMLDAAPASDGLPAVSDWQAIAWHWGPLSEDCLMDVVVAAYIKLDELGEAAAALVEGGRPDEAEEALDGRFSTTLPAWRGLCPGITVAPSALIDSSLLVVAEVEISGSSTGASRLRPVGQDSVVEGLLADSAKPIGHWLGQVLVAMRCRDLKDLSDMLDRKGIRHNGGRVISHDTLKGWSSMKPGNLMTLEGCRSLLEGVSDQQAKRRLLTRFAMARFLAFLCDFLRSGVRAEPPTWREAQRMLLARYLQIVEERSGWLAIGTTDTAEKTQLRTDAIRP